jgi:hypothetical protein
MCKASDRDERFTRLRVGLGEVLGVCLCELFAVCLVADSRVVSQGYGVMVIVAFLLGATGMIFS